MKEKKPLDTLLRITIGNRYFKLSSTDEQFRYLTMSGIFFFLMCLVISFGFFMLSQSNMILAAVKFSLAFILLLSFFMMRTNVKLDKLSFIPAVFFGAYCVFLVYIGVVNLWAAVWLLALPPIAIFLCRLTVGLIISIVAIIAAIIFLYTPIAPVDVEGFIRLRFLSAYFLILSLTFVFEHFRILKDRKEASLNAELAREKYVIETMKDNIDQGIFLMDTELKILPLYSKPLISILSYYDSELAGRNFLDILAVSLDGRQLQTMKTFFSMMFSKSKSLKVLEAANPISDFQYKIDDRVKTLSTKFHLVEQEGAQPLIIGIIQDITREREFEQELQAQKEAQQAEMKNMFDIIQIDPLVFQDFIDDAESKFNIINSTLKDRTLSEKQAVTRFFQIVHAMKSNAFILGLEVFGKKLHSLEDKIKAVLDGGAVDTGSVLGLAISLEAIMHEKDSFVKITNRIQAYKTSHKVDAILVNSLKIAVENTVMETNKKAELKVGELDTDILTSKLRKPIKDILLQCVRNSIYHGIETEEERIEKNKKPHGLLTVSIKNIGGKAEVVFSDDGRGLDWEKIKTKYLQLHPDAKDTSKKALFSSIFSPEFTTSKETTSVAGRGVGLSFVKDLVKEYNGTVNVSSSESGATFKFVFPFN